MNFNRGDCIQPESLLDLLLQSLIARLIFGDGNLDNSAVPREREQSRDFRLRNLGESCDLRLGELVDVVEASNEAELFV